MSGSYLTTIALSQKSLVQALIPKSSPNPNQVLDISPEEVLDIQIKTILGEIEAHESAVTALEMTSDCKYIISGSDDMKIHIWDSLLKRIDSTFLGHLGGISCLSISSDDKFLLSGSKDGEAKLWNLESRTLIGTFRGHSGQVNSVAFAKEYRNVFTCSDDGIVKVWDFLGNLIKEFNENTSKVTCCVTLNSFLISGSSDGRVLAWDLNSLCFFKEIMKSSQEIVSLAASSDGLLLACAEKNENIQVWNGNDLQLEFELKDKNNIKKICFSGNSEFLVVISDDYYVYLWKIRLRKRDFIIEYYPKKPACLCVNFDCSLIVSGFSEKCFRIWNSCERKDEDNIYIHDDEIRSIALTSNERYLLSGSLDKTLKIYDLENKKLEWEMKSFEQETCKTYSFNQFQDLLITTHEDGYVKFWDLKTRSLLKSSKSHEGQVWCSAINENLNLAATGSLDKKIIIWELNSLELGFILSESTHFALCLVFLKKSAKLISGGDDYCIKIWDIHQRLEEKIITGHTDEVTSLALSVEEDYLFSSSFDLTIKVWDLHESSNLHTFEGHVDGVREILLMKTQKVLISASFDTSIKFWNLKENKLEFTLEGSKHKVRTIALYKDETRLISSGDDGKIIIWNINSRTIEFKLYGHSSWVRDLILIDSNILLSCSEDKTILAWDLELRRPKELIYYEIGKIYTVAISADDSLTSIGDDEGRVFIINLKTRSFLLVAGHTDKVRCVTFSNDSKILATASEDRTIKIINIEKLQEDYFFESGAVLTVGFSSSSKYLISGSLDNSLKIWNLKTRKFEHTFTFEQPIYCLVTSKKEELVYFGCYDKYVRAVSLNDKKFQFSTPRANNSKINSLILDPSEKLLIYSDYHLICVFDTVNKKPLYKLQGYSRSSVNGLAFLFNSKKIISCSEDKSIKVWRVSRSRDMKTIKLENDTTLSMDITSDRQLLICGMISGEIKIWNTSDRTLYYSIKGHIDQVQIIKISSDSRTFASWSYDKMIKIWSISEKKVLFAWYGHSSTVKGILFINYDKTLVTCSFDKTIRFWNILSQKEENRIEEHPASFYCLHLHNEMIVSGSGDNKIVFWEYMKKKFELIGHKGYISCINSFDDKLISGSGDKTIKLWKISNQELLYTFSSHTNTVTSLLIMNEKTLLSSSNDKSIKSWNLEEMKEIITFKSHNNNIYKLVKLDDNKFISCSWDKTLIVWDMENRENSKIFKGVTGAYTSMNSYSHFLFVGSNEGFITVFDLNDKKECKVLWGHTNRVSSLEFCKNGSILISGSYDCSIKFWDLKTDSLIETKTDHTNWVRCLRTSPDQQFLLSGSFDSSIKIWRLDDRSLYKTLSGHKGGVFDIRISQDSSFFFSSSADFTIKMWDLMSGKEKCCFRGHTDSVWDLALIEEKKILISSSSDKFLKVWDYEAQRELFNLNGHAGIVTKLEISKNCKYLVSGSDDSTIKIWNILEKRLEYTLKDHLNTIQGMKIISESNVFCSCSFDGIIKIWEIQEEGLDKGREIKCENKSLLCDNRFILETGNILTEDLSNEFLPTHALDAGFNDFHVFHSFIESLKENSFSRFTSESSSLKISSCFFGVAHILAFLGKEQELFDLLSVRNVIFSDIFEKSPFYYAIVKNHHKCTEIILDFMIKSSQKMEIQEWQSSMFSLRNDFHLILGCSIYQIGKFLKNSMVSSQTTFLSSSVSLPCSKLSNYEIPISDDFDAFSSNNEKVQVYFMTFQIPIAMTSGSEESIQLIKAILNCNDKEIFSATIVKEFIDSQWNSVYHIIVLNSITYFINIYLLLHILSYGFNIYTVVACLVVNFILAIWEIAQIVVSWRYYLYDIWNWIDVLRLSLTFTLLLTESNILALNMIVVSLNFIRGITAFKMFDGTRYYIKLILRSISEVKYFLVMFAYSNIALGALYTLRTNNNRDFLGSLFKIYNINFGYFDINELVGYFDLSIFISATIINLIIILNLLISILGDFHDQFQLEKAIIDYQEKAETCLEIEGLLFWRRKSKEQGFLHKVFRVGENQDSDEWDGKILFLKNKIIALSAIVNELNVNITDKISKNLQNTGLDIKEKFENNLMEVGLTVHENHSIIESKVKELYDLIENKQKGNYAAVELLERKVEEKFEGLENKIKEMYELIEGKQGGGNESIKSIEDRVEKMIKEENRLLSERLNVMEIGISKILDKFNLS